MKPPLLTREFSLRSLRSRGNLSTEPATSRESTNGPSNPKFCTTRTQLVGTKENEPKVSKGSSLKAKSRCTITSISTPLLPSLHSTSYVSHSSHLSSSINSPIGKTFKCEQEGCQKSYRHNQSLQKHIRQKHFNTTNKFNVKTHDNNSMKQQTHIGAPISTLSTIVFNEPLTKDSVTDVNDSAELDLDLTCDFIECKTKFNHSSSLTRHLRIHNESISCTMNGCEKVFVQEIDLKRHLIRHSRKLPFLIKFRNQTKSVVSIETKETESHLLVPSSSKNEEQCSADNLFNDQSQLANMDGQSLDNVEQNDEPFETDSNEHLLDTIEQDNENIDQTKHNPTDVDVNIPNSASNMSDNMKQSDKNSSTQRNGTSLIMKLNDTTESTSFENTFKCVQEGCQKSYKQKYNLTRHRKKTHLNQSKETSTHANGTGLMIQSNEMTESIPFENTFKCEQEGCQKSYRHNQSLQKHIRQKHLNTTNKFNVKAHENNSMKQQTLIGAPISTLSTIVPNEQLTKDSVTHVNDSIELDLDLTCDFIECNTKFNHSSSLTRHLRMHFESIFCTVDGCEKVFVQEKDLKRHLIRHSRPLPFLIKFNSKESKSNDAIQPESRVVPSSNTTVVSIDSQQCSTNNVLNDQSQLSNMDGQQLLDGATPDGQSEHPEKIVPLSNDEQTRDVSLNVQSSNSIESHETVLQFSPDDSSGIESLDQIELTKTKTSVLLLEHQNLSNDQIDSIESMSKDDAAMVIDDEQVENGQHSKQTLTSCPTDQTAIPTDSQISSIHPNCNSSTVSADEQSSDQIDQNISKPDLTKSVKMDSTLSYATSNLPDHIINIPNSPVSKDTRQNITGENKLLKRKIDCLEEEDGLLKQKCNLDLSNQI